MNSKNDELEDIALLPPASELALTLDEVGLENVQMQVRRDGQVLPARGQAGVSLISRQSRGIHMSRLFKVLTEFRERELSWQWLSSGLEQMLASQGGLSDAGYFSVAFEQPVLRTALLSGERGWRTYPMQYRVQERKGQRRLLLTVRVLYSSTCPCSASLARQAQREDFVQAFGVNDQQPPPSAAQVLAWLENSPYSVPHSQRSEAVVTLSFSPEHASDAAVPWIDLVEQALGTPVQTAVKREDEQEFARLSGQNLLFCEDAARRLKAALQTHTELADFQVEVRHFESLHAHDVVARVGKFE